MEEKDQALRVYQVLTLSKANQTFQHPDSCPGCDSILLKTNNKEREQRCHKVTYLVEYAKPAF